MQFVDDRPLPTASVLTDAEFPAAVEKRNRVFTVDERGIPEGGDERSAVPPESQSDATGDDDNSVDSSVIDPGIAAVGAAVAARREELKLTQRHLARTGVVNASALIAFEKGRRWPRKATRTRIEDALQWPHGTLERKRREGNDVGAAEGSTGGIGSTTVRASLMASAVELALKSITTAVEQLPETTDETFSSRVGTVLADLRRLEAVAANAAQTTTGSADIALNLSAVRKCYRELMLRAARAPGATLGQQLYAVRHRTELSIEETAAVAGVPVEAITAAEAEMTLDDKTKTVLTTALTALRRTH